MRIEKASAIVGNRQELIGALRAAIDLDDYYIIAYQHASGTTWYKIPPETTEARIDEICSKIRKWDSETENVV